MRVAVIGSRTVDERFYFQLCAAMPLGVSEIVSGGAAGADQLAKRYAEENELKLTEFLPDYAKFGRAAPIRRNEQIVEYADEVIALWDGSSKGTARTINACITAYTPVRVFICK